MQSINSSFNKVGLATGNTVSSSPAQVKSAVNPLSANETLNKQVSEKTNKSDGIASAEDSQKRAQQQQGQQSFQLDEKTLAFLESNQPQSQLLQQGDTAANSYRSNDFIAKDQISSQNQTAVSSYQKIDNLAQRESVQQLLGIDLYA